MTRALEDGGPSDTRTTLTSAPLVSSPLARAALNVASPHGVGGYVLRMPKLGEPEYPLLITGKVEDGNVDSEVKVIPTEVVTCVSGVSGCSVRSAEDG
jgi:hypothetical protein